MLSISNFLHFILLVLINLIIFAIKNKSRLSMNNLTKKSLGAGAYTLYILWGIACFAFFQIGYHYHFFYQEQNQLFLWSKDYLVTYLDKPGWLACMAGDFFTQFYYYLYAGPAILTLTLLLLGHNIRRAMLDTGIKHTWIAVLVSFIIMTACAFLCLNHEYRLGSVFAICGGASVFRVSTRSLTNTRLFIKKIEHMQGKGKAVEGHTLPHFVSALSIAFTVPVCHWFFGSGVWTYFIFVIIGCINYVLQPYTYLRLGCLFGSMLILLFGKRLYLVNYETLYTYPAFGKFVKPEFDREKIYAADFEYYRGDYNKIIDIVQKEKKPNKYTLFYYNLVMAQNKNLSDNLLKYPDNCLGTLETMGAKTTNLLTKSFGELYWLLGDMNNAKRAAILGNINPPCNHNIRQIKRLAEINLVTGDIPQAKKFLRILQKTFVWRRWADRIFAALGRHATPEERATLQPYLDKRPFINTCDTLRNDDNSYAIMKELIASNSANNIAINYLLCTDLLQKNLEAFKHDYDAYYLKQARVLYDGLYQQALMIYLAKVNATKEQWSYYIKRKDLLDRFHQYQEQRGSDSFKDTYWYYYDRAATPKTNVEATTIK